MRLAFNYTIVNQEGQTVLEAETLHVCTSAAEKPKKLPDDIIEALKPFSERATGNLGP